jgi:hypothetical protein
MGSEAEAQKAKDALHQRMVEGRKLWLDWARPLPTRRED